jgi:ABC-type sugar transport system substrate-binding protein
MSCCPAQADEQAAVSSKDPRINDVLAPTGARSVSPDGPCIEARSARERIAMHHQRSKARLAVSVVAVSACAALALTSCSSSGKSGGTGSAPSSGTGSSTGGGSSTGSGGAAGLTGAAATGYTAALAYVNAHIKAPTSIAPTTPIGKPIPTGKTIDYVNCGAPACTDTGAGLKAAAAVLGWKYKEIAAQPTPQSIQAAFDQVIRDKPDGVASAGFATASYQRELATLKADNIPVFSDTGTDKPGNGLDLQLQTFQTPDAMQLLADKVTIDSKGKGDIANVNLTGYPIVKDYTDEFAAGIKKNCPGCSISNLSINPTSIGKDAPSILANFLRSHTNIKYVFLGYDDVAVGLAAAVKGAGIAMPKTYSWAAGGTGIQALSTGERTATVPIDSIDVGWQWADGFARLFTGQSVSEDSGWENFVLWSKDYNNLPSSSNNPPVIANYQAQFKKLWGK